MHKYLYLREEAHAKTWTEGGVVPLLTASTYWSEERQGTSTPDEFQRNNYNIDPRPYIDIRGGLAIRNAVVFDSPGSRPRLLNGEQWLEDGLVFCATSADPSWDVMKRFGKKCCVRIDDIAVLKAIFDRQVGTVSEMGPCIYTADHRRETAFEKGLGDKWQAEFRFHWKGKPATSVVIPGGLASPVRLWPDMWSGSFFLTRWHMPVARR
jgi:hypothetical protein